MRYSVERAEHQALAREQVPADPGGQLSEHHSLLMHVCRLLQVQGVAAQAGIEHAGTNHLSKELLANSKESSKSKVDFANVET